MKWLRLMRVHHYIKNGLVFAALAFSGSLFEPTRFRNGMLGFLAFCALSSSVYIINDLMDRKSDALHPTKRLRPIASGEVTPAQGGALAAALAILALALSMMTRHPMAALFLAAYYCLNIGYSLGLKNVPVVDVCMLASGFVIRTMYGAAVTDIVISRWLYLTVTACALYCALGKRRNEVRQLGDGKTRSVLKKYTVDFLDKNMYMCMGLVNVFYALWSTDEITMSRYGSANAVYTIPLVLMITMRYSMNLEGDSDGDPVNLLLHDKLLLCLCGVYMLVMFLILYAV